MKNIIFFIFVFFLPSQLGHYFSYRFSRINGVFIDYLSNPIYMTDILFLVLLFVNFKTIVSFAKKAMNYIYHHNIARIVCTTLVGLTVISIGCSAVPCVGVYKLLKIIQLILLIIIAQNSNRGILFPALFAGGIFQLILVVMQLVGKSSIQGFYYYFGERFMTLSTPGIAKAVLNGVEFLRPYGTFSHPNSLAGFYLLIYTFVLFSKQKQSFFISFSLMIYTLLVFFSFSKNAIFFYFLFTFLFHIRKHSACLICTFARTSMAFALGLLVFIAQTDPTSISIRFQLIKDSLVIISKNLLLGTGLGQYLYAQSQLLMRTPFFSLQPVHNIVLLFIAETGIIVGGIIMFLIGKFSWEKRANTLLLITISTILGTGMFDHYWLTLQQNILLMGIIIGMSLGKKTVSV